MKEIVKTICRYSILIPCVALLIWLSYSILVGLENDYNQTVIGNFLDK